MNARGGYRQTMYHAGIFPPLSVCTVCTTKPVSHPFAWPSFSFCRSCLETMRTMAGWSSAGADGQSPGSDDKTIVTIVTVVGSGRRAACLVLSAREESQETRGTTLVNGGRNEFGSPFLTFACTRVYRCTTC